MIMGRFGQMRSILAHDHETARAKVLPTPERGVRQLWKPPAWSSADHRSHGEPVTGSPRPAGAPVPHRDGRRRERLVITGTAAAGAGTARPPAAAPGGPGRRSTHPASSASRQAERPLRLPRKIRPSRNIRATGVARILPGSRILRENGTGEAERTKPSPPPGATLTVRACRTSVPQVRGRGDTRRVCPAHGEAVGMAVRRCATFAYGVVNPLQ